MANGRRRILGFPLGLSAISFSDWLQVIMLCVVVIGVLIGILELQTISGQNAMTALFAIEERMNSPEIQECYVLFKARAEPVTVDDFKSPEGGRDLRVLGSFFETVAANVSRGYVPYNDVRELMKTDITKYWEGVEKAVKVLRIDQDNDDIYEHLQHLAERIEAE